MTLNKKYDTVTAIAWLCGPGYHRTALKKHLKKIHIGENTEFIQLWHLQYVHAYP